MQVCDFVSCMQITLQVLTKTEPHNITHFPFIYASYSLRYTLLNTNTNNRCGCKLYIKPLIKCLPVSSALQGERDLGTHENIYNMISPYYNNSSPFHLQ